MSDQQRRQKTWHFPRFISEHAFDKLRLIDCTFAEFEEALETAEIIEETPAAEGETKELLLVVDWKKASPRRRPRGRAAGGGKGDYHL